ncbi:DUF697 domain-containing protein [Paludisphaera sp.]|uniref:DUF697 domain-containing protein n=1 Tax=Paludisphaera sp. TaxID=2017432 RepID=UPI00301BFE71
METTDAEADETPTPAPPGAEAVGPLLDDLERAAEVAGAEGGADAVERARESLKGTLDALRLTPEEERAMAPQLDRLRDLARKLDEATVEIVAFGMVSRGKSSVLNALLGRETFEVGATHGTTVRRGAQDWVEAEPGGFPDARLILVDTPGIDEIGGEIREAQAREAARRADLILFVISGDMQRLEVDALAELRRHRKPIILVFNQVDRYPDADRDAIIAKLEEERVNGLVRPEDVILCAARPDPTPVKVRMPDGSTRTEWERPAPLIEPLRARILDVLGGEGKALVALNTLLAAGDLHADILAGKVRAREEEADRLIWRYALAKGAAVAVNPVPVADLAGGVAVDVAMLLALSKVYGIPLTRPAAVRLVRDMTLALGATGLIHMATRLIGSGVKASMAGLTVMSGGLAAPLTALGYGAIGLTQAVAGATASYVIGHAAGTYLRQGGQWGPRGLKTVVQDLLTQARADSIVDRLRDDLKARVKP